MNKISTSGRILRILSGFLDMLFIFIVLFIMTFLYTEVFLKNDQEYQNAYNTQLNILKNSSLYEEKNGVLITIESDFDKHLQEFYQIYNYDTTSGFSSYEDAKEKSGYFTLDGKLKGDLNENDEGVRSFFSEQLVLATNILGKDPSYMASAAITSKKSALGGDISLFLSCTIVLLIIPLFLKDYRSLGKLITHMHLVSKHGNKIHFIQLFIRYLVDMIILVFFSTLLPGAFLLLQTLIICFTKKGVGLDDLIADTYVFSEQDKALLQGE